MDTTPLWTQGFTHLRNLLTPQECRDLRALCREQQRMLASETAARSRDDGHTAVECSHERKLVAAQPPHHKGGRRAEWSNYG